MENTIIEVAVKLVATAVTMLIGVLGTWLTVKISKRQELSTISTAVNELISHAQITVGELQQTVVEGLKAAAADGKLTQEEIAMLGSQLLTLTKQKLSQPAMDVLTAAQVDVDALIKGAGEAWIQQIKDGAPLVVVPKED